jgi:hypothetical protein
LAGFAAQPAFAASQEPVEADRIVAVVGDDVITYYELRTKLAAALRQLQKQGTTLPPQDVLEGQMLERLIMDRAQLQYARESGMRIDDAQLDQAIGRIAANNKLTMQQFREALEKDGIAYPQFRQTGHFRWRGRQLPGQPGGQWRRRGIPAGAHPVAGAGIGQPGTAAKAAPAWRAGAQAGAGRPEFR